MPLLSLACLVVGGSSCPSVVVCVESNLVKVAVDAVAKVPFFNCLLFDYYYLLLFDTTVLELSIEACWLSLELLVSSKS
jgi:hypothetical protein